MSKEAFVKSLFIALIPLLIAFSIDQFDFLSPQKMGITFRGGLFDEIDPFLPNFTYLLYLISVLFFAYSFCKNFTLESLRRDFEKKKPSGLTNWDWWTIKEIRERAVKFRFRAFLLFSSVVFVLIAFAFAFILAGYIGRFDDEIVGSGTPPRHESIILIIFSSNGTTVVIAGDEGSVYVTKDSGSSWKEPSGVELSDTEWITAAAFNNDGTTGVIVGDEGSVYVTKDSGSSWKEPSGVELSDTEWITAAAFSSNGTTGVIAGGEGSVYVTKDSGSSWKEPSGVELSDTEWITAAAFSSNGTTGVIAGGEGSVYVTKDSGSSWKEPSGVELSDTEWITAAAFSSNGTTGVFATGVFEETDAGDDPRIARGSVYVTKDSGFSWTKQSDLNLSDTEWITVAAFNSDGTTGVIAGDEGSVYVTQDSGSSWKEPSGVKLSDTEWITAAAFSSNGTAGVIAGDEGSVYVTQNSGFSWKEPSGVRLNATERITAAAFSSNGTTGVIAGDEGSVYVTQNSGFSWKEPSGVRLNATERITAAAFSSNGATGVIAGDEGSVYVTQNSGFSWRESSGMELSSYFASNPTGPTTQNESVQKKRSALKLKKKINTETAIGDTENVGSRNYVDLILYLESSSYGIRIIITIITSFLVGWLVRLYRYALRISVFCDSRADALLLAATFSSNDKNNTAFKDLMDSLSPDSYDFKSSRFSPTSDIFKTRN